MLNVKNRPRFGTDPEAFFQKAGQIIGSEKIIPANGLRLETGKVVRDGVQFELNPDSEYDVAELGRNISHLFEAVQGRVEKSKGVSICFDGLVEVSRKELDSLSPGCRVLGCMPSYNAYEDRPIQVDPFHYRKRSSGGHIHAGFADKLLFEERRRAIPVYDILVGNTAVLLDRDPGSAERRENYGRAGEFRLPDHGLEYRTTSNFWLRDFTLMSFTFGMAHIAHAVALQSFNGDQTLWNDLAKVVNIKRIVQAIDTNDFTLALKNFKRIVPFLKRNLPKEGFVLTPTNIDSFIGFAQEVEKRGMEQFFPAEGIVQNWVDERQTTFDVFLER